jgi:hypothetical protein
LRTARRGGSRRWAVLRDVPWLKPAVRFWLLLWGAVGAYDLLVAQFLPDRWTQTLPRVRELYGMASVEVWILSLVVVLLVLLLAAVIDHLIRHVPAQADVQPERRASANSPAEVTPSVTQPLDEARVSLREQSPDELVARINSLNPLERDLLVKQTYVGRRVRWSGTVLSVEAFTSLSVEAFTSGLLGGFTVTLGNRGVAFARLEFSRKQRPLVESIQEGDLISYEATIARVDSMNVYLADVTVTPPADRSVVDVTPQGLTQMFRDRTHVQATSRAADVIDKWMKVSGPLGDVRVSSPSRAQVTFAHERGDFTTVYMYFRGRKWVNRVSLLKVGDTITVLGRISEIQAYDVHLDNCELVEL